MADFCKQCAIDMGFDPAGDFEWFGREGHTTTEDTAKGEGVLVLCEGCGPTVIDHLGRCMADNCLVGAAAHRETLRRYDEWVAGRSGPWGWVRRLSDWWNGTLREPGQKHYLKWRYYDLRNKLLGRSDEFHW